MKVVVYSSDNPVLRLALEEIKRKLEESKVLTDFDFMIIALNYRYPYENLDKNLRKIFGINSEDYFAFHATESFANVNATEGISVAFIKFENKGKVKVFTGEGITDYKNNKLMDKLLEYLEENRHNLNIFISGWHDVELGYFIEDLGKELEKRGFYPNLVGGVSSGKVFDGELRTFQFYNKKIIKDGFGIITFENVDFAIGISLGFKPISPVYRATKVKGYQIYEVDHGRNFKEIVSKFLKGMEPKVEYLWYCPIILLDDKEGYVSVQRTYKSINEDSVEFFAPIPQDCKFMLSFGSPETLLESTQKEIEKMKQNIGTADVVFNFSCIARQYILEDRRGEENLLYTYHFDAPLFGFSTYGEIGPDKFRKKVKLYNETSLGIAIKERE